jgi:hypothetical protein
VERATQLMTTLQTHFLHNRDEVLDNLRVWHLVRNPWPPPHKWTGKWCGVEDDSWNMEY